MSRLARAKKPVAKPPLITITGGPGTGKTTLGALFPNVLILPAEDGTSVFEGWDEEAQPTILPRLPKSHKDEMGNFVRSTRAELNAVMDELMATDHPYQTLVIDSITTLNLLFEHEITLRDDARTVADAAGGFHKGYTEVASWHADFIYKCEQLRAIKNMAVVFLAHTGIKRIRNSPDAAADYSVFSMDMSNESLSIYTSQSDLVTYLILETLVVGAETNRKGQTTKYGRVTSTGERKLITASDGRVGYVNAKTRYASMPSEIAVPHLQNPLTQYINFFNNQEQAK